MAPAFSLELPQLAGWCAGIAIPDTLTPELLAALHPEEQRLLATLPPGRQPSFAAGRAALHAALVRAGLPDGPLLVGNRGQPVLPPGALGSISHKRHLAVGLAAAPVPAPASASDLRWNVGVDLEERRRLKVDISRRVLTQSELERWQAISSEDDRDQDLINCFSLKEALYKAVNGFLQRFVSWRAVEVAGIDEEGRVTFGGSLFEENPLLTVEGWQLDLDGGFVLSSARACWRARG